jgi:hypothetical protein
VWRCRYLALGIHMVVQYSKPASQDIFDDHSSKPVSQEVIDSIEQRRLDIESLAELHIVGVGIRMYLFV